MIPYDSCVHVHVEISKVLTLFDFLSQRSLLPTTTMSDAPGTPCLMQEQDEMKITQESPSVPSLSNEETTLEESSDTIIPSPHSLYLDDVDRMLCHEDFGSLLALAVRVKQVRDTISLEDVTPTMKRAASSEMDPQQVIHAVTRMQQQHLMRNYQDAAPVIKRGTYHMTDSLLNENFHILQQEMERCNKWIAAAKEKKKAFKKVKSSSESGGEAIAVKYAKWQTDVLMEWMLEHVVSVSFVVACIVSFQITWFLTTV